MTGGSIAETEANFDIIVEKLERKQAETGVQCLWGTCNLFSHRRFMNGACTNPDPDVVAMAAAQVKKCLEVTKKLGGANFVMWGGRDGYQVRVPPLPMPTNQATTPSPVRHVLIPLRGDAVAVAQCLLNTNYKVETDNYAAFLKMTADYADKIGFTGQLLLEPKPREPTAHQYNFDAETTLGFLEHHGLIDRFALNLEANHGTLAGHSGEHETEAAAARGKLGSIDANRNEAMLGWCGRLPPSPCACLRIQSRGAIGKERASLPPLRASLVCPPRVRGHGHVRARARRDTDMFPTDPALSTYVMKRVIEQGGLAPGGLNFDAKVRPHARACACVPTRPCPRTPSCASRARARATLAADTCARMHACMHWATNLNRCAASRRTLRICSSATSTAWTTTRAGCAPRPG